MVRLTVQFVVPPAGTDAAAHVKELIAAGAFSERVLLRVVPFREAETEQV